MNEKVLFYYDCMDKMLAQLTKEPKAELFSPPELAQKCGLNLTTPVAHLLCNKMVKDDLIERFPDSKFCLSEESIFFIEEGGYIGKFKHDASENTRLEKLETEQRVNQRWMTLLTAILSVGALIAAIYSLVELYWKYHWFH